MMCNKCGTQNNEGSRFCIGCGNNLETMSSQITNSNETNSQLVNNISMQEVNNIEINPSMNNNLNTMQNNIDQPQPGLNDVQNNKREKKPINKKMLFIIGGAVLAVVVVVLLLVIFLKGNKSTKNLENIFDLDQPIPVYKDGGFVYIDTKGKITKDVKYRVANDFNGDYAYVELDDGTAALIDKNQNVMVKTTSYYGLEYLSNYDVWLIDGVLYNNKLKPITKDTLNLTYEEFGFFIYSNDDLSEYGIMNAEGKKIYTDKCSINNLDINDDSYDGEYYGVLETSCYHGETKKENEYLIELQTGRILYTNEYKSLHPESRYYYLYEDDDNIFYIVDDDYNKIERFYLKDNKIVYSTKEKLYSLDLYGDKYLKLDYGYDYDSELIAKEQRYYYYNLESKKLEKEEPILEDDDTKAEERDITKRQIVTCNYGEGLIDNKKVIVPCIYYDLYYLYDTVHDYMEQVKSMDLYFVEDYDGQTSVYDANSRKDIIKFEKAKNSEINDYKTSLLLKQEIYTDDYWDSDIERIVVYNLLTRKKIIFDKNSSIEIKSNYFIETKNGKKIYYNMDFEKIYTEN